MDSKTPAESHGVEVGHDVDASGCALLLLLLLLLLLMRM